MRDHPWSHVSTLLSYTWAEVFTDLSILWGWGFEANPQIPRSDSNIIFVIYSQSSTYIIPFHHINNNPLVKRTVVSCHTFCTFPPSTFLLLSSSFSGFYSVSAFSAPLPSPHIHLLHMLTSHTLLHPFSWLLLSLST